MNSALVKDIKNWVDSIITAYTVVFRATNPPPSPSLGRALPGTALRGGEPTPDSAGKNLINEDGSPAMKNYKPQKDQRGEKEEENRKIVNGLNFDKVPSFL